MVSIEQDKNAIDISLESEKPLESEKLQYAISSINSIRDEFDDHLNAINENTLEIKDNYERICHLDQKIESLAARLETTYMMVTDLMKSRNKFSNITLDDIEQKVFLGVYMGDRKVSYSVLSKKLGMKRSTIRLAIASMRKKEIPVFIHKDEMDTHVIMEARFKELQAKEHLIKIDEKNQKNLFVRDLRYFF